MKKSFILAALAMGLCLSSCTEKIEPVYSGKPVTDVALKTALEAKGVQFNEAGCILINEAAEAVTELDLSGKKVADFAGLEALANLTELNLSGNEYGPVFDFATVPAQVTSIDLTNNEIYDFEGLVDAKVENDEVVATTLHKLTKLYLPESAKWNVEDLMPFYMNEKDNADIQMAGKDGKLAKYTTLREIPDAAFANYLKGIYSSIFSEDGKSIDISKPLSLKESGKDLDLFYGNPAIKSPEGIEYFINNPYYEPFSILMSHTEPYTAAYMMPGANIIALDFTFFNTPMLDLSKATNLAHAAFVLNDDLKSIDLSNTLVLNQDTKDFDQTQSNMLFLSDCANLKNIVLPEKMKGNVALLQLSNLPVLESIDLKEVKCAGEITLLNLPKTAISYPTNLESQYDMTTTKVVSFADGGEVSFAVSQDVFDMEGTKNFINKYKKNLYDNALLHDFEGAIYWSKKN